jgi:hypothetical protein
MVIAAPLGAWMASVLPWEVWARVVDDTMSDRPGVWRLMRGALAYLAIPGFFIVLVLMLIACFRRSVRAACVLAGVALLSNVSVQLVKHGPLWLGGSWSSVNPLSGHVGVAAGVCFAWLVVAPSELRRRSALASLIAIAGVSAGVVLAGWHTLFQVFCPMLICAGCALVGRVVAAPGRRADKLPSRDVVPRVMFAVAGSAALSHRARTDASTVTSELALAGGMTGVGLAVSLLLLRVGSSLAASSAPAMTLTLCSAMGLTMLAVGGTWLAAVLTPERLDRPLPVVDGQRPTAQLSANHD